VIELRVRPARAALAPLVIAEPGVVRSVRGVAFASHLAERRVTERMAQACEVQLERAGIACAIERHDDRLALHPGASLAVWAETSTGARVGADRVGARRRSAESIGRLVAEHLLEDLAIGATTDRYAADQLVLFAALAAGTSEYVAPRPTEHLETNLWLAGRFGATARLDANRVRVDGIGVRA
jgi:RNA 3'-terminal phosphate cyclase (ATP)